MSSLDDAVLDGDNVDALRRALGAQPSREALTRARALARELDASACAHELDAYVVTKPTTKATTDGLAPTCRTALPAARRRARRRGIALLADSDSDSDSDTRTSSTLHTGALVLPELAPDARIAYAILDTIVGGALVEPLYGAPATRARALDLERIFDAVEHGPAAAQLSRLAGLRAGPLPLDELLVAAGEPGDARRLVNVARLTLALLRPEIAGRWSYELVARAARLALEFDDAAAARVLGERVRALDRDRKSVV